MATSKSVKSTSKMRTASRICKLGAWVIVAIGIAAVGIYVSTILPAIPYLRLYPGLSSYTYISLTGVISALFLIIVPTLFFAIVLYALGTFMEYTTDETKLREPEMERAAEQEEDDERMEIVPIPEMR